VNDTDVHEAQLALLKYIKVNSKTLDELEAIINELYEKFGLK
jgi:hypothetical protein